MTRPVLIAALTCHNRRPKTLACLGAFFAQNCRGRVQLRACLVDAGSTDGTPQAVRERFPQVELTLRDESLFWCGGMRIALEQAAKERPDYFLWLNDDTTLYPDALDRMFAAHACLQARDAGRHILVGSTRDPLTGELTYGGVARASRWHPFRFRHVPPGGQPRPCDTLEGNCVLLDRATAERVGALDGAFTHGIGDTDYGLRARRLGCRLWVAPGFAGSCAANDPRESWDSGRLPLRERWAKVRGTKSLPPREHKIFTRRHGGVLWPLFWSLPYVRAILGRACPRIEYKRSQLL